MISLKNSKPQLNESNFVKKNSRSKLFGRALADTKPSPHVTLRFDMPSPPRSNKELSFAMEKSTGSTVFIGPELVDRLMPFIIIPSMVANTLMKNIILKKTSRNLIRLTP
jgi:hypothetical protein